MAVYHFKANGRLLTVGAGTPVEAKGKVTRFISWRYRKPTKEVDLVMTNRKGYPFDVASNTKSLAR